MLSWVMVEMSEGSEGIGTDLLIGEGMAAPMAQPLTLSWSRSVEGDRE